MQEHRKTLQVPNELHAEIKRMSKTYKSRMPISKLIAIAIGNLGGSKKALNRLHAALSEQRDRHIKNAEAIEKVLGSIHE